jgi:hypothetical protein
VFLLSACVDETTQIAMIKGINIRRAAKDPEKEKYGIIFILCNE